MKPMTSRERVRAALNHQQPDRVPLDLGTTPVTGIHVSTYAKLRKALGLPSKPPKVEEPYQMLAEVEPEVAERLGLDTVGLSMPTTIFGFPNVNWKPFKLFDSTDVLVSEYFRWEMDTNGDLLLYPAGDTSVPPSGRMPKGGNFFDAIPRQEPDAEAHLDPREFAEQQISPYTDEQLAYLQKRADELYRTTDKLRSIHLCGDATRHFKTLRDELRIVGIDTGFPVDFARLRRELGPNDRIQGGPHIEFLRTATPQEVREEVRRILQSGVLEGRLFVLREGNNLAPHTPIENTEALYRAGREFGAFVVAMRLTMPPLNS
ncbi:MAG: hypothetical protein EXS18_00185 [Verrucomicrobiae bacterium]|nr:hypothetical protein [Verrucomicrobiae bacterium]